MIFDFCENQEEILMIVPGRHRADSDASSGGDTYSKVVNWLYRVVALCLPARNEKVVSEIGFHESIYRYLYIYHINLKFKKKKEEE